MSDQKPQDQAQQPDVLTNLKAEMDRKFGNLEETNKKLMQTIQGLSSELQQSRKPAPQPQQQKSASEMLYDDPDAFVETVVQKAVTKSNEVVSRQTAAEAKKNAVLNALYSDYPEIADNNSALTKKALEIYGQLPEEDRSSPMAYKVAVRDAAAELGVMPKSKRQNADDFSFGGSGSGHSQRTESKSEKDEDKAIVEVASLFQNAFKELGQDVNDPKFQKRLIAGKNRNFKQYE